MVLWNGMAKNFTNIIKVAKEMKNMQEPGKIIKNIAKNKNLKLSDISNAIGMVYQTLSIKISKSKFTLKEINQIANTLGCTLQVQIINPETKQIRSDSNVLDAILSILEEKKLHQSDLAKKIGTSRQNISKILKTDPCNLQIQQLITYINALEYTLKMSLIDNITDEIYILWNVQPPHAKELDYLKNLLEKTSLGPEETDLLLTNYKSYIESEGLYGYKS